MSLKCDCSESSPRVTGGSALVGGWSFGDTLNPGSDNTGVVVFLSNGCYFQAQEVNDSGGGSHGMERGTWTWDMSTGATTFNAIVDTNGETGLSGIDSEATMFVTVNTLPPPIVLMVPPDPHLWP